MKNDRQEVEKLQEPFAAVISSCENFSVDFDEAWQWIGYSSKQKALDMLEKNFIEGEEFSTVGLKTSGQKGGKPATHIMLTVDCFKAFCMLAQTERGKEVRRYYIRLEKEYHLLGKSAGSAQINPIEERRQLRAQINQDENELRQLESTLLENQVYQQYREVRLRIEMNKNRLKQLNASTVKELNQMADGSQGKLFVDSALNQPKV